MAWDLTYLIVHVAAMTGVAVLYRRAPDEIQKIFLLLTGTAMAVYVGADVAALFGAEPVWPVRMIASRVEHTAMLLYITRQVWIRTEICRSLKLLR